MTGFPKRVRELVTKRSQDCCEICGLAKPVHAHHRRPRGAGGSKAPDTNTAANCLWVCLPCHEHAESYRAVALDRGWLVRQGQNPADVPVIYQGNWAVLDDDGFVFRPPSGRDRCVRCGFHVPTQQHRPGCQEAS